MDRSDSGGGEQSKLRARRGIWLACLAGNGGHPATRPAYKHAWLSLRGIDFAGCTPANEVITSGRWAQDIPVAVSDASSSTLGGHAHAQLLVGLLHSSLFSTRLQPEASISGAS
jgi:hypothetical protein